MCCLFTRCQFAECSLGKNKYYRWRYKGGGALSMCKTSLKCKDTDFLFKKWNIFSVLLLIQCVCLCFLQKLSRISSFSLSNLIRGFSISMSFGPIMLWPVSFIFGVTHTDRCCLKYFSGLCSFVSYSCCIA